MPALCAASLPLVPAAAWRPAPESVARGGRAATPPDGLTELIANIGRRYAHTVDVIDPARGVLASVTVENMTVQPFDSRYARRIVTDPVGFVQVEIWEVLFPDGR
jgi:hypothetical protein